MDERLAPSVRFAEVQFGDDLRRIALRELGDAGRWLDLVLLNELRPPYIAEEAGFGVLGYGDEIMVPAPGSFIPAETDAVQLFGADVRVNAKRLEVEHGDFAVASGIPNLSQALTHHVMVEKRELAYHPAFGSYVRSLIGHANGPAAGQLAAFYVKSAMLQDERVDSVPSCTAVVLGDQISVSAVVAPITGKPFSMEIVL